MLDVHPPHEPTHTWKDFFVHIATICVGLLIAIGLEQSVEWLHHRHQIHELQDALKSDGDQQLHDLQLMIPDMTAVRHWIATRSEQVQRAMANHTSFSVLPFPGESSWDLVDTPAWSAAATGGIINLLRRDDMEAYGELAAGIQHTRERYALAAAARSKRVVFEEQFHLQSGLSGTTVLPNDVLLQYLTLLRDEEAADDNTLSIARQVQAAEKEVLRGERNLARILAAEDSLNETL